MKNKNNVYIIAEIGVNHNGSIDMAKKLIDAAVEAGVDAVKFQTYKTEQFIVKDTPKAGYQLENTDKMESQYDMLSKLELSQQMHHILKDYCEERKIDFLSSPFDLHSLSFLLDTLMLDTIKIPSGEITNGPLLLRAAAAKAKIILSTGMATLGDIEKALSILAYGYTMHNFDSLSKDDFLKAYCSDAGQSLLQENVTLLHCTSEYPAPFEDVNLHTIKTLKQSFGLSVGYSDHTLGIALPIAAVALGASVIEKHFTLNRNLPGPDHKSSLEPEELYHMVQGIRQTEAALGKPYKKPSSIELKNQKLVRKSIVAACDIEKDESFTEEKLTFKRPGNGISPMELWDLLGKKTSRPYKKDEVIE